jgi:hypothetical protein
MTNFARSNQSWVSRTLFGAAKSCPLVNLFMICPLSAGGIGLGSAAVWGTIVGAVLISA